MKQVAINGFGRIGRNILRAILDALSGGAADAVVAVFEFLCRRPHVALVRLHDVQTATVDVTSVGFFIANYSGISVLSVPLFVLRAPLSVPVLLSGKPACQNHMYGMVFYNLLL